jgi:hypothetical protein
MGGSGASRLADSRFKSRGFMGRNLQPDSTPAAAATAGVPATFDIEAYSANVADSELTEFRRVIAEPGGVLSMYVAQADGSKVPVNPLAWHEANQSRFPYVGKLARRILCIPATSASSERMFSIAGQIVTKRRNHLSSHCVTQLIWLFAVWTFFETRTSQR